MAEERVQRRFAAVLAAAWSGISGTWSRMRSARWRSKNDAGDLSDHLVAYLNGEIARAV
jgi:hypothetical protein